MKLAAVLLVDVLNPLFAICFALFVGLGYILTVVTPMTIDRWQALLIPCFLIPFVWLLALARRQWKRVESAKEGEAWMGLLPLVVPLAVLTPGLYAIASSPTVQILSHPDLHFGYINQLINGSPPLENVFVAGHPANYYWLFHAFVAAVAKMAAIKPAHAATLVNVTAVFSSFLWIGRILVALKLARPRSLALGVWIVFVFCSVNITGVLSLFSHVVSGAYAEFELRQLLLEGGAKHMHSALHKLANINSMDLGISLFAAALFCCIQFVRGQFHLRWLALFSACGILGLAAIQLVTVYMVVALAGGLGLLTLWKLLREGEKLDAVHAFWRRLTASIRPMTLLLYFVLSLALSLPLLKYSYDIAYNTRDHTAFALFTPNNMETLWAALALLIPLFALQCICVFKSGDDSAAFIQISGALGLLLGSGLSITDGNHYKGYYFLAIVLSISAMYALRSLRSDARKPWRRAGQAITLVLLALVFLRIAYINVALLNRDRISPFRGFGYDGMHITHTVDEHGRFPAYYWIRDNTEADALVITPLDSFIFASVLPERQFYVKKAQYTYTTGIEDYDRRVRQLSRFYRDDTGPEAYHYISRNIARHFPERPIYAVVKDSEVSREVMAGRDAELVYEHDGGGANVYRLYPSLDPPEEG